MAGPILRVRTLRHDDEIVLTLAGDLDIASAPDLLAAGDDVVAAHAQCVVIDLADLDFADVRGIDALGKVVRRLEGDGADVRVRGASAVVRRLLLAFGLQRVLQ